MKGLTALEGPMAFGPVESIPGVIGKYRLLAELGHGGMARVFLAVAHGPSGFSKLVVLKMIRVHLADDPDSLQMFLDEARLAGRLNHPNVVHTLEVVEEEGRYMMVMEYLEGQTLAAVLRRARHEKQQPPLFLLLRGIVDVLQGLHYAHELKDFDGTLLNLIHRDVSPQNIFVTYDGQVKVLDFGIAKAITSSSETKAGVIKGKIAYMAPEQFLGEKLDRRVDIYGVGAVLWQLATGERLWRGLPDGQVIHRVIRGDIPSPETVNPDCRPELVSIVMKALSREREDRYRTCIELQGELETFIEKEEGKVTSRELGTHVATVFSDSRKQIGATIEAQLSKAQNYDTQAFDQTAIPSIHATGLGGFPFAESSSLHSGLKVLSPGTDSGVISASMHSNVSAISNSIPNNGLEASSKRKSWIPIVVVAALLFGVAGLIWFGPLLWKTESAQVEQAAASTALVDPTPVETASAVQAEASDVMETEVDIEIQAKPADARIFFDDSELATNPATRRVPKGKTSHKIRAEAKNYETREVEVTAEKDVVVTVALDRTRSVSVIYGGAKPVREDTKGPAKTQEPTPPALPPSATTKTETKEDKSARERIKNLDKGNPWEQ